MCNQFNENRLNKFRSNVMEMSIKSDVPCFENTMKTSSVVALSSHGGDSSHGERAAKGRRRARGVFNSQAKSKMIRNTHNTFGIIVMCAIVCNTSNHYIFLAFNFGYRLDFSGALYNVSVIGAFSNCCVNPFVYVFKYKMFQHGLKRLFCGCSSVSEHGSVYTTHSECRPNVNTRTDTLHM